MRATKQVRIYTTTTIKGPRKRDGAFGYLLEFVVKPDPATLWKAEEIEDASENKAELMAVIKALRRFKEKCQIEIFTDSEYVAAGFTQKWIEKWIKTEWKTAKGKDVANKEEWQELSALAKGHEITFKIKQNNSYRTWMEKEVLNARKGE